MAQQQITAYFTQFTHMLGDSAFVPPVVLHPLREHPRRHPYPQPLRESMQQVGSTDHPQPEPVLPHAEPERPRRQRSAERTTYPRRDNNSRTFFRKIADTTIAAINNGMVDVSGTQRNTRLYSPDDAMLVNWRVSQRATHSLTPVEINILPLTTLKAARHIHTVNPQTRIGILNFASATKPGGGFLSGARAQEESIARSSTLYASLTTAAARPFYAQHARDDSGGFYSHAMIYSPGVHLLRDDDGEWAADMLRVDVLTSPAVNAGDVRKRSGRRRPAEVEARICDVMRERMARILALFERKGARQLVLGSFGTGVFQNDVQAMATLWHELLHAPRAPFAHSFDYVVFAIPDQDTRRRFGLGFNIPASSQG